MQRQFLREARLAAAVQHPNVVHITDFGTTETGNPFIVMELLRGETLAERLRREGVIRADEVMKLARRVLDGLHAVHSAAVVHRDLKPENIFLVEDRDAPYPKILDFGISRSVDPGSGRSSHTTREGILVGTPEYMSPEQVRGLRDIDTKSDLYSLGVIMYEALTGDCPYSSENRGDLIIMIAAGGAPPARMKNAAVRRGLSDVIERAMATDRERRFRDAAEMQIALEMAEANPDAPIASVSPLEAPQREAASTTRRDTARIDHPTLIADPPAFSIDTRMRIGAPIAIAALLVFAGSAVGSTIWISHELTSGPETEVRPTPSGPPTRARAPERTPDPEPAPDTEMLEPEEPPGPPQPPIVDPPGETAVEATEDADAVTPDVPVEAAPGMRNDARMRTAMQATEAPPPLTTEEGDPPRTLRELDY
jgi:serine/threonine-protein kinase